MSRGKTIVLADSVDDVVIVTPRSLDRVRGVIGRELLIAASAQGHPAFQVMMTAVTPCFAPVPETHVSGSPATDADALEAGIIEAGDRVC